MALSGVEASELEFAQLLGDLWGRLGLLEDYAREVRDRVAGIVREFWDDLWVLFRDRAVVAGFEFVPSEVYNDGGTYYVRGYGGVIRISWSKMGVHVAIRGMRAAEQFLRKYSDILDYVKAVKTVEQELKQFKNLIEKAEDLAEIYGDESILEETLKEIEKYLDEPRIVG